MYYLHTIYFIRTNVITTFQKRKRISDVSVAGQASWIERIKTSQNVEKMVFCKNENIFWKIVSSKNI